MYIKLEKDYNAIMNRCIICKKTWDPKCKWTPCHLQRLVKRKKDE